MDTESQWLLDLYRARIEALQGMVERLAEHVSNAHDVIAKCAERDTTKIRAAVLAEREACAVLSESGWLFGCSRRMVAQAIRNRE